MTSSCDDKILTDDVNQVDVHNGKISCQNVKWFKSYLKKSSKIGEF